MIAIQSHPDTKNFPRVFKPRVFMRLLGWGFIFVFGGLLAALLRAAALSYSQVQTADLWTALGGGVFLLLLALLGVLALRSYFVLGADYIEDVRPWGTRRFAVSELAGYDTQIISFNLVPTFFIQLYRRGDPQITSDGVVHPFKQVTRIRVSFADRAEVEGWCAQRLPMVDHLARFRAKAKS